jgi:hypothetical protein
VFTHHHIPASQPLESALGTLLAHHSHRRTTSLSHQRRREMFWTPRFSPLPCITTVEKLVGYTCSRITAVGRHAGSPPLSYHNRRETRCTLPLPHHSRRGTCWATRFCIRQSSSWTPSVALDHLRHCNTFSRQPSTRPPHSKPSFPGHSELELNMAGATDHSLLLNRSHRLSFMPAISALRRSFKERRLC